MKAVILAAGYATRMAQLTMNQSKPLINVAGKPIIEYILDKIKEVHKVDKIFIVTNHRFYDHFRVWLNNYNFPQKITLVDDGTISNDTRLGAIGDLRFTLDEQEIDDDLMLIAGDNLFQFSLSKLHGFFQEKKSSVMALCDLKEKEKLANKFGVAEIDANNRIINFEEKPARPKSTLCATVCYILKKEDVKLLGELFNSPQIPDNIGDTISFLISKTAVYGFPFAESWIDIGSPEQLKEAEEFYQHEH